MQAVGSGRLRPIATFIFALQPVGELDRQIDALAHLAGHFRARYCGPGASG